MHLGFLLLRKTFLHLSVEKYQEDSDYVNSQKRHHPLLISAIRCDNKAADVDKETWGGDGLLYPL